MAALIALNQFSTALTKTALIVVSNEATFWNLRFSIGLIVAFFGVSRHKTPFQFKNAWPSSGDESQHFDVNVICQFDFVHAPPSHAHSNLCFTWPLVGDVIGITKLKCHYEIQKSITAVLFFLRLSNDFYQSKLWICSTSHVSCTPCVLI